MTRRFFFGLIPALLAAAKWPIEKPVLKGRMLPTGKWVRVTCVAYTSAQQPFEVKILPADTEYLRTLQCTHGEIARAYNVPPHLLKGLTDV